MKRTLCMVISCILLFLCAVPAGASTTAYVPTRVINVVYDDSGSMYSGVDTWCRAKYSMEVFSAMLGDADKMNVYYMSDYCNGSSAPPRISLDGADGSDVNVTKMQVKKYISDHLLWLVMAMIWYRNVLFTAVPGMTVKQSKIILRVCPKFCVNTVKWYKIEQNLFKAGAASAAVALSTE